jgi:hypothetical protein
MNAFSGVGEEIYDSIALVYGLHSGYPRRIRNLIVRSRYNKILGLEAGYS